MPLFGSKRDSNFILGINRELIKKYIDTEIEIYKLSLEDTNKNIYGESTVKIYYDPVRIHSLVNYPQNRQQSDNNGYDINRSIKFGFIKNDLESIQLVLESGDILGFDNAYYEVDVVYGNQYWGNRNPDTLIGNVLKEHTEFGYKVSIVAEAHLTRETRIQIRDTRSVDTDTILRRDPQTRQSIYGE